MYSQTVLVRQKLPSVDRQKFKSVGPRPSSANRQHFHPSRPFLAKLHILKALVKVEAKSQVFQTLWKIHVLLGKFRDKQN